MTNEPMEIIEGEIVSQSETTELMVVNEINKAHEAFMNSMQRTLEHAVHCGQLLLEQKKLVAHGEWMLWVSSNCNFKRTQADAYMRIASNYRSSGNLPEGATSIVSALRLLQEPKEDKQLPSRTLASGEEEVLPRSNDYAPSTDPYRRVVQQEEVDEEPKVNAGFSWMKDPAIEDALDGLKALSIAIKLLQHSGKDVGAGRQVLRLFRDTLSDLVINLNKFLGDK